MENMLEIRRNDGEKVFLKCEQSLDLEKMKRHWQSE